MVNRRIIAGEGILGKGYYLRKVRTSQMSRWHLKSYSGSDASQLLFCVLPLLPKAEYADREERLEWEGELESDHELWLCVDYPQHTHGKTFSPSLFLLRAPPKAHEYNKWTNRAHQLVTFLDIQGSYWSLRDLCGWRITLDEHDCYTEEKARNRNF